MAQLTSVKTKTISEIFQDRNANFLIPVYQRAYVWEAENECQALWDDIVSFAFPEEGKFDTNEQYFLGSIVTFRNENKQLEVIDGQQRLTTFMLLLCALYEKCGGFDEEQKEQLKDISKELAKCIWKTDELGKIDYKAQKLKSEVVFSDDGEDLAKILTNVEYSGKWESQYAENYDFFIEQIGEFAKENPTEFAYLPARILNNCILLPIEADSQDFALTIFNTLNDRGQPLGDTDVFKAKLYGHYSKKGKQNEFIEEWNELAEWVDDYWDCGIEGFFKEYMYFKRAERETRAKPKSLRDFYKEDGYKLLNDETFENLKILVDFWHSVCEQDKERFSERVLKSYAVSNAGSNDMQDLLVSVYFMFNKDQNGKLDEAKFFEFLQKINAFFMAKSFVLQRQGATFQTQIYNEMINIKRNRPLFEDVKFDADELRRNIENFNFAGSNLNKAKQILTWWAFENDKQKLINPYNFEVEHIFAKKTAKEKGLDKKLLECLGNKALLESDKNKKAKNYEFSYKKKVYKDSDIAELQEMANSGIRSFNKEKIIERNEQIIDALLSFVEKNGLLG